LTPRKLLVVNADDFGFTRDVNLGIVEAHRYGALTSTTLMANGDAFDHAVRLAHETPTLDIGVHMTLIGGRSLATGKPLPSSVSGLLKALALGAIPLREEMRLQMQRILDAGLKPTHFDTHKHAHLAPPVLEAIAATAEEFGIRWVRGPFDLPVRGVPVPLKKRLVSRAISTRRLGFRHVLGQYGCRMTDHFVGFQITGRFEASQLAAELEALPEGITELMVHPGHCGDELRAAPTRLLESRERELAALLSSDVKEAIRRSGARLAGFGALE